MNLLPLERILERKSKERSKFPSLTTDYFLQYQSIVAYFHASIYKNIDAGLSANPDLPGIFTAHNAEHFDEVVRYAGLLLGVETGDEEIQLTPYELYVLLVAIRTHDAGNIHGRKEHEKQCFSVLRNSGAASGPDVTEKKMIALIAQAHGGETPDGSKDTIGTLEEKKYYQHSHIRPRLLASIVRFADEICENRNRANNYLLDHGSLPKHNEIFHKYAASITSNCVSIHDKRIILNFTVSIDDVNKAWGCLINSKPDEKYLIDEILDRLEKMDRERQYCNKFSRDIYTIDAIRSEITIVNADLDEIERIIVPELNDYGYPDDKRGKLKNDLNRYCGPLFGKNLADKLSKEFEID